MAAQDFNIIDMINEVTDDINNVLGKRRVEEYFTSIVLLYSFIENILVWLVYAKLLWDRAERGLSKKHVLIIRNYCNQLSFHSALQLAFAVRLFDSRIFERVSKVKEERNRMLHQLWLYEHRKKRHVLRKKLEQLARIANELVRVFNKLVRKTGADRTYSLFIVRPKKGILV
jgi:hypothetical protein